MSCSSVEGVRVAGIASAVPDRVVTTDEFASAFGADAMENIARSTGIRSRHVTPIGVCTSDLCLAAAERLIEETGWDRSTIDMLILVTQTPDYIIPATSCSLHSRLGLSKQCAAFDVNLGCSGYTYGLWLASHMISSGGSRRVLLLAGEVARRLNPHDRSARPLFGDAGTATLLERQPGAGPTHFRLGTNGEGQNYLIIPAGGYRKPSSPETAVVREWADGNMRSLEELYMDGSEVFLFTLDEVPGLISGTLEDAGWSVDDVDAFVFHQANEFMLKHLADMMGLPLEKVPLSLAKFGNTSSASIPLTMTAQLASRLRQGPAKLVLAGFGIGWSWASVAVTVDRLVMPDLVVLDAKECLERLFSPEGPSHLPEFLRNAPHDVAV